MFIFKASAFLNGLVLLLSGTGKVGDLSKVRIKGKMEQSREKSSALPHLGVVAFEKGAFVSPSTKVANFTYIVFPFVYPVLIYEDINANIVLWWVETQINILPSIKQNIYTIRILGKRKTEKF